MTMSPIVSRPTRRLESTDPLSGSTRRSRHPLFRAVFRAVCAVVLVVAIWELVKTFVPTNGVSLYGTRVLPRTDDGSLPSPGMVLSVLNKPEVDIPGSASTGATILQASWLSFRLAAAGFLLGVLVGTALGLLMFFVRPAEHALLPYLVVAPTVPILAIAPLVAAWSGKLTVLGQSWQSWMSVVLISSYLCLLPVAAGLLRGLSAPATEATELMRCMAARRLDVLRRLQLPAAVPYLIPAMKLAAAAAVVSAIVSEIATGTSGGLGRLILDYASQSSADGSRLYAAVIASAVLGMAATGLVAMLDLRLRKYQAAR